MSSLRNVPPSRLALLPGTLTSCLLLTVLTVLLAAFAQVPAVDAALRPLYFAWLAGYLLAIGRRHPRLVDLPFRLVQAGAVVWTLSSAAATVLRLQDQDALPDHAPVLIAALERGAFFILGLTLVAYGILLWLPRLVVRHRKMRSDMARTRGLLRHSEQARVRIERQAAEMARMQVLSELSAGIAHDLRNPLAIVHGAAEALVSRSRSQEELAEHADVILRNVEKAERTIKTLLDLGKPGLVQAEGLAVAQLLDELRGLVGGEARRCQVQLHCTAADDVFVHADRALLLQVLVNLVLNGVQASPADTTVTVCARSVDSLVAFSVEDRGVGLTKGQQARLFTPFYSTRQKGTGLGLVSCRRLIDDMGGRIRIFRRTRGGVRALVLLKAAHVLVEA